MLWGGALLNPPLLRQGKNIISVTALDNSEEIAKGQFEVLVQVLPKLICKSGVLHSSLDYECKNSLAACRRYFDHNPKCKGP